MISDLSGNAIAKVDTDFQDETFTNLTLLYVGPYVHFSMFKWC